PHSTFSPAIATFLLTPGHSFHVSSYTPPPTPTTSSLSLHDALPILHQPVHNAGVEVVAAQPGVAAGGQHREGAVLDLDDGHVEGDRKSTRLNSSHVSISYAVFCFKKKIIYFIIKYIVCLIHML